MLEYPGYPTVSGWIIYQVMSFLAGDGFVDLGESGINHGEIHPHLPSDPS